MADTQQWITLEECIYAYISRAELSESKYLKLWNIAYDFLIQNGLDAFFSVTSVMLPVNANQTVSLPDNYLQYSKVGILNDEGEIYTLKRNDRISKLKPFSLSRPASQQTNDLVTTSYNSNDYYNYWNDGSVANIYGCGGYEADEWTVNEKDGLIYLSGLSMSQIVLEYIASPAPDEQYKVPVQFKQAAIDFIAWQSEKYVTPRKGMAGVMQARRQDYYNEKRLAKKHYNPFDLEQAKFVVPYRRLTW